MVPFDTLTELFEIAMSPWSRGPQPPSAAPTPESLSRIQRTLGIGVPEDFARLAAACPSYGVWFASIGDDFGSSGHIVMLNELFHDGRRLHDGHDGPALPPHFVMLNHGHDGDCDCWDTRVVTAAGEHPIVYVRLEVAATAHPSGVRFESFRTYVEEFALRRARGIPDRTQRRRARRLIEQLGLNV
jgi:hypothetical protein